MAGAPLRPGDPGPGTFAGGAAVNLFSDTQTRPSPAMRAAMAAAEVGDEQRFADPTTTELERRVADLLGHQAAVFLPSGTMCNQIALRLHARPGGDELLLDATAHPILAEAGGPAAQAGLMIHTLDGDGGIFDGAQVQAALRPAGDRYQPRSRVLSVEQTTNMGGGRVWPLETIRELLDVARRNGLRTHLDGARIMNAVVASGVPAANYAAGFDTAWLDFTKGLGAPLGAVLCASRELIDQAWRWKQMVGGALRQSGVVSAACLVALDQHVERLAEDHEHARLLADGLRDLGLELLREPETNIVIALVDDGPRLAARLAAEGVQVSAVGRDRIRCVTHLDVDRAGIERALQAFRRVLLP